jgi:hypothetical protein
VYRGFTSSSTLGPTKPGRFASSAISAGSASVLSEIVRLRQCAAPELTDNAIARRCPNPMLLRTAPRHPDLTRTPTPSSAG